MQTVVVSLGGSLLFSGNAIDYEYLEAMSALVRKLAGKCRLAVIVGGGRRAREYAEKERNNGRNEFFADRAAMKATKENAELLVDRLSYASNGRVSPSFDEIADAVSRGRIAVGCGMLEGLTTDAISVLCAERLGATRIVNLSNTDGIYSADPKKNKAAKKFKSMTHAQLLKLAFVSDERKAGTHFVFDAIASKLAARSGMELHFVDGRDLGQAESAILGKKHDGTVVKDN